jgi:hypothetical protein
MRLVRVFKRLPRGVFVYPAKGGLTKGQSMLKNSYDSQDAIPENQRGAYVFSGDKWVLDRLSDDHPTVAKNKELLAEVSKANGKVSGLQDDLAAAKQVTGLGRGQVAVAKADGELLEKVKPHGTADEIVAKLTEHATLKLDVQKRTREDSLRAVAKELGYEGSGVDVFLKLPDLPEFEIRGNGDGKKVIAKVKEGNTVTEKPANEVMEANYSAFAPALKPSGVSVNRTSANGGKTSKNVFDRVREDVRSDEAKQKTEVHPMFRKISGHAAAQTGE